MRALLLAFNAHKLLQILCGRRQDINNNLKNRQAYSAVYILYVFDFSFLISQDSCEEVTLPSHSRWKPATPGWEAQRMTRSLKTYHVAGAGGVLEDTDPSGGPCPRKAEELALCSAGPLISRTCVS